MRPRPGWFVVLLILAACRTEVSRLDDVQRMAYGVKPAVVRVTSLATADFVPEPELIEALRVSFDAHGVRPSAQEVKSVETGAGGSGTGFIVHPDGFILTSAHVIEPTRDRAALERELRRNGAVATVLRFASVDVIRSLYVRDDIEKLVAKVAQRGTLRNVQTTARVELSNGEALPYAVRAHSPMFSEGGNDLALLKIERKNLPILSLADSDRVHLQEPVWAVGYPSVASSTDDVLGGWLSGESDLEATFNPGSITAMKRTVANVPLFQSNVAIYAGNSGGPAVNRNGEVVGISSWGHSSADQIRFLLPINLARALLAKAAIAPNQPGAFNRSYRGALEAAAGGEWLEAKENLDRARALFPNSPDLIRFTRDAEEQIRNLPVWRLYPRSSAGVAALLVVGALFGISRLRRPARPPLEVPAVKREHFVVPEGRRGEAAEGGISATVVDDISKLREAAATPLGRLTVLNGDKAGERFGLGGSGIRIGRETAVCEIVLENPKVSRLHAEVVSIDGRVLLIDRNSSNGTYVNDRKIDRHYLRDGDIIYFGGRNAVAVAFHS